jgi:hypothetical protein
MTIKPDKNGQPFGYCDSCRGQLRIGGSDSRVSAFYAANPDIAKAAGKIEPSAVDGGSGEKVDAPAPQVKKSDFTLFEG